MRVVPVVRILVGGDLALCSPQECHQWTLLSWRCRWPFQHFDLEEGEVREEEEEEEQGREGWGGNLKRGRKEDGNVVSVIRLFLIIWCTVYPAGLMLW